MSYTQTPLLYYMLRESELKNGGERFGPMGSAILIEVFGGILKLCGWSFVHEPHWLPDPCVTRGKHDYHKEPHSETFAKEKLLCDPDYYPFELADVARYVEG